MEEKEIKTNLLENNVEFRKTYDQHQKLKKKLIQFHAKSYLTEDERLKEKQLKKKTLLLKDRMYSMMTEFGKSVD